MPHSCKLRSGQGSIKVIGSIRKMARRHPESIRKSWEFITKTRQFPHEIALGVAEKIETQRSGKGLEWRLHPSEWMSDGLVKGSCPEFGYSRWDSDDPGDSRFMRMRECHLGTTGPNSHLEWIEIIDKQMLCRRRRSYYTREGSLIRDLELCMSDANNALKGILLAGKKCIDNSALPPGLTAIASLVSGGIDPRIMDMGEGAIKEEINKGIDALDVSPTTRSELMDRLQLSEEWDFPVLEATMQEVCQALGSSLVAVGPNRKTLVMGSPDNQAVVRDSNGECSLTSQDIAPITQKEKLRTIFWNSNGWNADKGQRIADLAAIEGASVIGITDVRINGSEMGLEAIFSSLLPGDQNKAKMEGKGLSYDKWGRSRRSNHCCL